MGKTYGYCRVSTRQQKIERQESNIKDQFPDAIIYKEAFTGTKMQGRKELDKILRQVSAGDTIVFDEVSRMSRNAKEGFQQYVELFEKGVELVFLKEPHINTSVYKNALESKIEATGNEIADCYIDATNKVLRIIQRQQIELAFDQAQKEVDHLHARTREGMAKAAEQGRIPGRRAGSKIETNKSKESKKIILKHNKDFGGSLSNEETWTLAGISKMTFYKYKKELIKELS